MLDALVYSSEAGPRLTDAELEVILVKSRTLNGMRGLTGALLKDGDCIVQYLEGEAGALDRTFARIAASSLHSNVRVLARSRGVERVFDTWHMGFRDFQPLHSRGRSTEAWEQALDAVGEPRGGNDALRMLRAHWDLRQAA